MEKNIKEDFNVALLVPIGFVGFMMAMIHFTAVGHYKEILSTILLFPIQAIIAAVLIIVIPTCIALKITTDNWFGA